MKKSTTEVGNLLIPFPKVSQRSICIILRSFSSSSSSVRASISAACQCFPWRDTSSHIGHHIPATGGGNGLLSSQCQTQAWTDLSGFSQIQGYKAQKYRNWGSATSGNCCHTTQLRVIHFLHLTLTFVRMLADIVSNGLLLQFDCRSVPTVKLQWSCTCRVLATYSTCLLQNFFFFFAVIQHQLIHKSSSDLDGTVCIFPLEGGLISPLLPPSLQEQYSAFLQKNFH